ncbi:MAG: serine--tRNA ligase [Candidatus Magasanikbacteria bacterium RIFOXYC2_FULL_42_28]|uniref:Serine--tRNA ligase n=1 Tax=Candidatus Magasanikbacteria bacterium RIFOXYC2_FULL_42_28 TaxID=1798704 RepID=A0A1F6NWT9_9BACT|nr:MAG: serine--tRNA ligase [Candidatus Magasanikbacteria bacterium RIFOXYC2_FULL_42_28]
MLDIKFIRENAELVKNNCLKRRVKIDIDKLLATDEERRSNLRRVEELRALRNQKSKGKPTEDEITKMRTIGDEIKSLESELTEIENEYHALLLAVPNLTNEETPVGGEEDFKVVKTVGKIPKFDFPALNHEELLIKNDLIDFERGTKVAGAKFYFVKNNLVRLNQALINYGIDVVTAHGYTLVETPDLAKNEILSGIGFNPRGEETQVYSIENTDLSLIGTAEITMGGYHANEVLDLSKGAKKYVALSHCFRTEAGAYGRESKGLYRVHQFAKLEMFIYCKPEESEKYHAELLEIEKEIIDGLELPYRVIDIASSDLGGPAYRKFDIEAWMTMKAGDGKTGDYGEITSTSNCTDYQARRLNIKYRKEDGGTEYVHTLNGTAVVLSRFPLAIVENYQQADGTIAVPKILQKYCGLKKL